MKNNESIISEKRKRVLWFMSLTPTERLAIVDRSIAGNPDPRLFRFEGPDRHEQELEILKLVLEETRKQN